MPEDLLALAISIKERTQRTRALVAAPDALGVVCAFVADGGSLPGLCDLWNVRYSEILAWINSDKERQKAYVSSLDARTEWVREKTLALLRGFSFDTNIKQILDDDGRLKPVKDWPDNIAAMITGVTVEEIEEYDPESKQKIVVGHAKSVKMLDKKEIIKLLGQTMTMFTERKEVSHKMSFEELVGKGHRERTKIIDAQPAAAPPKAIHPLASRPKLPSRGEDDILD